MDSLTPEMLEECCQLTKQNSIEGCKLNDVKIVYTPWSNLKKTNGMDVGQIGFHSDTLRRFYTVAKKNTQILNALEKTKVDKGDVDFQALREERDAQERRDTRRLQLQAAEAAKLAAEQQRHQEEIKSYASLMDPKIMHSNQSGAVPDEEDFM
jgi:hypothetical protein